MRKIDTGASGEEKAATHLIKKGYKILTRNFKNYLGEIDIIASDKEVICFVEVRSRRGVLSHEDALRSIDSAKQRRLSRLAVSFLKERKFLDRRARFDVVSVSFRDAGCDVLLLKDAFPVDPDYS
ncbi:MAG TPA: YraN family protein [Candidatus Omnitrophica bacterium]|nr:YraN family protein [Candidatus Omnitrophota bacterium]